MRSAMQIDHDLILCNESCVENGSVTLQRTYNGINIDGYKRRYSEVLALGDKNNNRNYNPQKEKILLETGV